MFWGLVEGFSQFYEGFVAVGVNEMEINSENLRDAIIELGIGKSHKFFHTKMVTKDFFDYVSDTRILLTVKSPTPHGQSVFIKIADLSVCPTGGDLFFWQSLQNPGFYFLIIKNLWETSRYSRSTASVVFVQYAAFSCP